MQETKDISLYKQGLRSKILDAAMAAFGAKGIRAVKMDDVASELGISKRTLYEIYGNKELLLYEGVVKYHQLREEEMRKLGNRCKNVMEILLVVYRMKVEEFQRTNPMFYVDLVKYPKVQRFLEQKNLSVRQDSMRFLKRGIEEGYFRSTLNYELVSRMFDALGGYVLDSKLYQEYSMKEIFDNLVFVFMRGICTERGIAALDQMDR